jgi:hypothetical protein
MVELVGVASTRADNPPPRPKHRSPLSRPASTGHTWPPPAQTR